MPSRLSWRPAPAPSPGQWGLLPDPADLTLLDWAHPDPDTRVLLLGPNCLELMCSLIRGGSLDVAALRLPDRPEPASADLVVIANLGSADALACAITHARRALVAFGSVVIGLPADRASVLAAPCEDSLRRHGFVRLRRGRPGLRAELPLEGGLSCA